MSARPLDAVPHFPSDLPQGFLDESFYRGGCASTIRFARIRGGRLGLRTRSDTVLGRPWVRLSQWASSGLVAVLVALSLPGSVRGAPPPPEDKTIPFEQYTSDKARELAQRYVADLRTLYTGIYHCLPWVEVEKRSVGFQRPKFLGAGDHRYLALRIFIEQDPAPAFDGLPVRDQASAMYSRYVGPILQRMTRSQALTADPNLDGFSIILEWRKQWGARGTRPVHATVAVFLDKESALAYLAGRMTGRQLVDRAKVFAWDGETALGQVPVTLSPDNFVATYKIANYEPEPGVSCP